MRNLASVITVKNLEKLPGKDKIVLATFEEIAYEAIVPCDYKVGDIVAWIGEGSLLPVKEEFEFLRKRCYKESLNKFLIRPMVMGKKENGERVKSWGLCLKLSETGLDEKTISKLKAGDDITELLHIEKYEAAEDASPKSTKTPKIVKLCMKYPITRWIGKLLFEKKQNSVGSFPTFIISKSDETTIQNCSSLLQDFADETVYASCKMEGQSFTCLFEIKRKKPCNFYVCSRNNAYKTECDNDFWRAAKQYNIKNKLYEYYKKTGKQLVLQGEQCGPGIQQNIYNFDKLRWFIYSIKIQNENNRQVGFYEMEKICEELGLETVPIMHITFKLKEIMPTVEDAVSYAEKQYWKPTEDGYNWFAVAEGKLWKDYLQHEGVVVRTLNYDKDKNIGCSFKIKNIDYQMQPLGQMHDICKTLLKK